MADPSTLAILASIAEYAEYVGTIISAIKTAQEVLGQPNKQQDEVTQKILEAIARAEASVIDEIHTAALNEHIGAVEDASRFWGNNWLYIVRVGITYDNLESNDSLHGVEFDMPIKRDNVSRALAHFHQAGETLPPTAGMLRTLLGSYSLYLSMETVWTTFTWVRNLQGGNPTPPNELLNHTAVLSLGRETIEAWLAGYLRFRRSQITTKVERSRANDETHSPAVWDYEYLVEQDLGGDPIIDKLQLGGGSSLASFFTRTELPAPTESEPKIMASLRRIWEESENGGKAVEVVFGNWNGVKTQVDLLLHLT